MRRRELRRRASQGMDASGSGDGRENRRERLERGRESKDEEKR